MAALTTSFVTHIVSCGLYPALKVNVVSIVDDYLCSNSFKKAWPCTYPSSLSCH